MSCSRIAADEQMLLELGHETNYRIREQMGLAEALRLRETQTHQKNFRSGVVSLQRHHRLVVLAEVADTLQST